MFLIIALIITGVIYIRAFKDDFTPEYIDKLKPALTVLIVIAVIFILIKMLMG